ncbi:alcohol dehydrogenase [Fusarium albosuccineum]|uniref:Alcohol dehydrogenase n=1 Tax=Fusarium albosuccineum TaxID=1237068 RepID=A0A8H4L8N7_9HYPO|nr:alcohol dehydrogenase [Fusarium albosuccineum]
MKEAIVSKGPKVEIIDSPIPVPQKGQVLIRVVVAGSNPKDVKSTFYYPPANSGDDVAGYVEAVGDSVLEFHPNDRVAAFHEMVTPHGAFAEYAIAWAYTTFHIPDQLSFEEAATVPLASMTAALGLYYNLRLPPPWTPDEDRPETGPLVIYGAGSAVGSFAVQFAKKSKVHPIICVAGQSKDHVESLIDRSKGDVVIDYRLGFEAVVAQIKKVLAGKPLHHAFDAVSDHGSDKIVGAVIDPKARFTMSLPKDRTKIPEKPGVVLPEEFPMPILEGVPESVEAFWTAVGIVHNDSKHFGHVFYRYISLGLQEGWFKPHPHQVVSGGLNGVDEGLTRLLNGEAHGFKFVYRIADTEN